MCENATSTISFSGKKCEIHHFPPVLNRVEMCWHIKELLLFRKLASKDKWSRNLQSRSNILSATINIYNVVPPPSKNLQKSPVLLSAHVKRFSVSHMRDFSLSFSCLSEPKRPFKLVKVRIPFWFWMPSSSVPRTPVNLVKLIIQILLSAHPAK